jgi:hypothetical protein
MVREGSQQAQRRPNVLFSAKELIEMGRCPFMDGRFEIKVTDPCPICGALGNDYDESAAKCVG